MSNTLIPTAATGAARPGDDAESLRFLDFLRAELAALHDRGLLADAAFATVAAEVTDRRDRLDRRLRSRAALARALDLRPTQPHQALAAADEARSLDPDCLDAWELAYRLRLQIGNAEAARALQVEGAAHFPDAPLFARAVEHEAEGLASAVASTADDLVGQARAALRLGRDAEVVQLCEARLDTTPDDVDALVLLAFARQRRGEAALALPLYRRLTVLQPDNPVWAQWVDHLKKQVPHKPSEPTPAPRETKPAVPPREATPVEVEPATSEWEPAPERLSWSSVAGEFLQDHWQKLILCLAVLLIVVSSNIGAYQLLGPVIWSPVGKTVLALLYTAMIGAFGAGLVRWGAERAGRIMLLTTLVVVPANFMLAGEMKLAGSADPFPLAILAVDAVGLLLLIRAVGWALGLSRGAWTLAAALFGLGAVNAVVAPGAPWPWSWQFALFLAPGAFYLAVVSWLNRLYRPDDHLDPLETTYAALGLLSFAYLAGVVRTGGFVLQLVPTLYAVPTLFAATAAAISATYLVGRDKATARAGWLRFVGLSLAALGLALALARPPLASPLYSGNTLAAAVLALLLFGTLLARERHPAFLYVSFGTLLIAYFGAFYFVRDLMHAVEEAARHALGYHRPLPPPFKAINGLVFNTGLAGLAVAFRRRWDDARLARHCHYLGLPFSVACCVFSAFEPKAAAICLPGYAILYALGVVVFRQPRLIELSAAALAGGVYFGASLVTGVTPAHQALLASLLGLAGWGLSRLVGQLDEADDDRRELVRAAVGLGLWSIVLTAASALPAGPVLLPAALAPVVVAITALLLNRDQPRATLAYLATLAGSLGYALLVLHVGQPRGGLTLAQFALASAAAGLGLALLRLGLRWTGREGEASSSLGVFLQPLEHTAFLHVGLTFTAVVFFLMPGLGALTALDFATIALGLGLAAVDLLALTGLYPSILLAWATLAVGFGAWLAAARPVSGQRPDEPTTLALALSTYALAVVGAMLAGRRWLGDRGERTGPNVPSRLALFGVVIPDAALVFVVAAVAVIVPAWATAVPVVGVFAVAATAIVATLWLRPEPWRVDLAVGLVYAAALSATATRVPSASPALTAWQALTTSGLALVVLLVGRACASAPSALARLAVVPCGRDASVLAWLAGPIALVGWLMSTRAYPQCSAALGLAGLVALLLAGFASRPRLTYRAIGFGVAAVYVTVFSLGQARPETMHVPGLIAIGLGLLLQAIGYAVRAMGRSERLDKLYVRPAFRSAALLTTLGVAAAWWSPAALGLAAASYLVLVKSLNTRAWLYPTVAAAVAALYFGPLHAWPAERLVTAAVVIGYQLWVVAWLVQRWRPLLVDRIGLVDERYDIPLYNSAAVAGLMAGLLRLATLDGPQATHESWALLANLAVLAYLMARPYPGTDWLNLGTMLASWAVVVGVEPRVTHPAWWLAVTLGLANGWLALSRGGARLRPWLVRWVDLTGAPFEAVWDFWSRVAFALGSLATAACVALGVLVALGAVTTPIDAPGAAWWGVSSSLVLAGLYVGLATGRADRDLIWLGVTALAVLAVWWVGAPGSPVLAGLGWGATVYLPLATAALALGEVGLASLGRARREASDAVGARWLEHDRREFVSMLGATLARFLGPTAVLMAMAGPRPVQAVTLLIVAHAMGLLAVLRRGPLTAYFAGVCLTLAGALGGLEVAARLGPLMGSDRVVVVAAGLLAAVGLLWLAAGWTRRIDPDNVRGADPSELPAQAVAIAMEHVCLVAAVFCAAGVVSTVFGLSRPTDRAALAAVGILLGLTLAAIGLLLRWGATWLVYPAHAAVVGSYLYYRWAFPLPAMADAGLLTLLGYLNFGLAEVMHRVGLGRYAGPTRRFALVVPVLPLALAWWGGPLGETTLFLLLAASTFYGVACVRLQSRPVGYASAVLFNAFLWFLWWRVGYAMADRPQFFLVPVGLSAILFAEANRGDLPRRGLNALRGVGLSIIYLSLAVPIWDHQSLGAWAALLFLSLAGVFVGIGLRVQTFLWLGLAGFILDVVYQLGHVGAENTLAKWAIMLALGIGMVLFVALNEKKQILKTLRDYYDEARSWE